MDMKQEQGSAVERTIAGEEQTSTTSIQSPIAAATTQLGRPLVKRKISRRLARRAAAERAGEDFIDGLTPPALKGDGSGGGESEQKSAGDIGEAGFSGAGHEIPHRREMEASFGTDFSNVRAYTDSSASQASRDLGAHAYTMGDQVAFRSANPDKATVAHELAHVVQNTRGVACKADDEGIETSGEAEAEAVEHAVGAGKNASAALASGGGTGVDETKKPAAKLARKEDADGEGAKSDEGLSDEPAEKATAKTEHDEEAKSAEKNEESEKKGVALKRVAGGGLRRRAVQRAEDGGQSDSKIASSIEFTPSKEVAGNFSYTVLDKEIPIIKVPLVTFYAAPSLSVKASVGKKLDEDHNGKVEVGVEGSCPLGLAIGEPEIAALFLQGGPSIAGKGTYTSEGADGKEKKGKKPAKKSASGDGGRVQTISFGISAELSATLGMKYGSIIRNAASLFNFVLPDIEYKFAQSPLFEFTGLKWEKKGKGAWENKGKPKFEWQGAANWIIETGKGIKKRLEGIEHARWTKKDDKAKELVEYIKDRLKGSSGGKGKAKKKK